MAMSSWVANDLQDSVVDDRVEIMFEDGLWILAQRADLDFD